MWQMATLNTIHTANSTLHINRLLHHGFTWRKYSLEKIKTSFINLSLTILRLGVWKYYNGDKNTNYFMKNFMSCIQQWKIFLNPYPFMDGLNPSMYPLRYLNSYQGIVPRLVVCQQHPWNFNSKLRKTEERYIKSQDHIVMNYKTRTTIVKLSLSLNL